MNGSPDQPNADSKASPAGGARGVSSGDSIPARLPALFAFLLLWLFALVVVGGTVRLTRSGMSIPDWPIIYYGEGETRGSILPPFTGEAWAVVHQTYHADYLSKLVPPRTVDMAQFKREFKTEYTHRALAMLFGIPYLAAIIWTFSNAAARRKVGGQLAASMVVLPAQAILGGAVVLNHTPALHVAVHLGTAFVFIALIVWITLTLHRREEDLLPPAPPRITKMVWVVLAIAFLQVFTGGIMAKTEAARIPLLSSWPLIGGKLIPVNALWDPHYEPALLNLIENKVLINFTHRWWAIALLAALVALIARLMREPLSRAGRWNVRAIAFLVTFQILVGILTLTNMVPTPLGILHLGTGLVLFQLLVALLYEVRTNNAIYLLEQQAISRAERALATQVA